MKKAALWKNFFREIQYSFHRFASIVLIVALGVAFFAGIRATKPDMQLSADTFYDESNLMDIRILGTLGLTEEDLSAIRQTEGVRQAVAAYSCDVLGAYDEGHLAIKMLSDTEPVNRITVKEGRMPENDRECLLDEGLRRYGYELGDQLQVSPGNGEELSERLGRDTFEVVGLGTTSYYLSLERGNTSIGSGSLDGFAIVKKEAFSMEAYTEIDVTVEGAAGLTSYTPSYDDQVDQVVDRIKAMADVRCDIRYQEIQKTGQDEIADAEQKIADARAEIADARQKLTEGMEKIQEGEAELASQEKKLADGREQLESARAEIADGWAEVEQGQAKLSDGEKTLLDSETQLNQGAEALEQGRAQLAEGQAQWHAGEQTFLTQKQGYEENLAKTEGAKKELAANQAQLDQAQQDLEGQLGAVTAQLAGLSQAGMIAPQELLEAKARLEYGLQELAGKRAQLDQARAELAAADRELAKAGVQIALGEQELAQKRIELQAAQEELDQKAIQLQEARLKWEAGKQELEASKKTLADSVEQLRQGEAELLANEETLEDGARQLDDARRDLEDARRELEEGLLEFEREQQKAEEEISKGEAEIADGKTSLEELKKPEWYVLDRQYIQSYVEYGSDADRIGAIGEVFPVIFFLVAALVSLTTMTRMVEEERVQIGTLKALGYSSFDIAWKYILYALSASLLGSLVGLAAGQKILPMVIINAYAILYNNLPEALAPYNMHYALTATLAAVACTTLATVLACYKELLSVSAQLMRPAVPKNGKRILLERITGLWNMLSFTYKATLRNLFRYKKRFYMTIFGIGGCMALILVGYGIKDSITSIGDLQYGKLMRYQAEIALDEDAGEEEQERLQKALSEDEDVDSLMKFYVTSMDVSFGGRQKSAYLTVPEDGIRLGDYVRLTDRLTGEDYALEPGCAVITEKLKTLLGVEVGDTITLGDEGTQQASVRVSAVAENYYMHYVYMDSATYAQAFGKPVTYNEIRTDNRFRDEAFEEGFREKYLKYDAVSAMSFTSGIAGRVNDMLKSMDTVIYVLIISAGLLAFVVLYNLNHINIAERRRELATIKVLGFYNMEVAQYVYRENVFLTFLGVALGVVLGNGLHRFVIRTAEIDMLMFGRTIRPVSYGYSVLFTVFFTVFINFVMYYQLRKINMVESLKSVE